MIGLNYFEFIGYLTKEPELHDDKALVRLAINREYRDSEGYRKKHTDYFIIFFYNRDATNVGAILHTGDLIYVRGRIEHNVLPLLGGTRESYKFRAVKFLKLRSGDD